MIGQDVLSLPIHPAVLEAWEIRDLVGRDDPVILDIGANCGQTTGELLDVFPQATIFAFEPDPRAIADFRLNVCSPRVRLFECAVGATNGTVTFHQSSGADDDPDFRGEWDLSGSIRRPHTHLEAWPWVKFERRIEVPIVTLDAWAGKHQVDHVDFIWADVQGAESDLVQGASRLLQSTRYLYTEYSNDEWFEGQVDLPTLAAMIPEFEVVRRYKWDVLFRNRRYPPAS
jgi:FkbM family methyltransferase